MQNKIFNTVIVDAFGGDNAPFEIIKGGIIAVNRNTNLKVIFTGNEDIIKGILNNLSYNPTQIEVIDAKEIITNEESPTMAIKQKTNSSLVVGLDMLRNGTGDGIVSAGSTGAVLTGGFLKIGRLEGVLRPALAPILPTKNNGNVLLIDCGANMDSKPQYLVQFAIMGTVYAQKMFGIKKPRVALLSVGVENKKGNELTKTAFEMLSKLQNINFVGNMEARDFLSGQYDVVVADGFAGNVLLKSTEGAAQFVLHELKTTIKESFVSKVGAIFMRKAFKKVKAKFSYEDKGGSPFLGAKKILIKSHGSSKAETICSCINQVVDLKNLNINQEISKQLEQANKIIEEYND